MVKINIITDHVQCWFLQTTYWSSYFTL